MYLYYPTLLNMFSKGWRVKKYGKQTSWVISLSRLYCICIIQLCGRCFPRVEGSKYMESKLCGSYHCRGCIVFTLWNFGEDVFPIFVGITIFFCLNYFIFIDIFVQIFMEFCNLGMSPTKKLGQIHTWLLTKKIEK